MYLRPMRVSGFTFIRNAIHYDYPIVEAIHSILPLCDEVVVAVGNSIAEATFRAIYTDGNARIQLQAESLGGPINFLSDAEGRLTTAGNQNAMERPWNLWKQQAKRKA